MGVQEEATSLNYVIDYMRRALADDRVALRLFNLALEDASPDQIHRCARSCSALSAAGRND